MPAVGHLGPPWSQSPGFTPTATSFPVSDRLVSSLRGVLFREKVPDALSPDHELHKGPVLQPAKEAALDALASWFLTLSCFRSVGGIL